MLLVASGIPLMVAQGQTVTPAAKVPWQSHDKPGLGLLSSASFADDNTGWAVGINSISRTINGGRTWAQQWSRPDAYWFNSVVAVSPQIAMTTGFLYGKQGAGIVLRTEDGGANWRPVKVGSPDASYHSLVFRRDKKIGYLVSTADGLMKTTDGGLTWSVVDTPQKPGRSFIAARGNVALPDDQTVYVGSDNTMLLHSGDDGATWDTIELPKEAASPHLQFLWVRFADVNRGWVNPFGNDVWETRDGGKNWQKSALKDVPFFQNSTEGWAVGAKDVSRTTDGGQTWTEKADIDLPQDASLISLAFTSKRLYAIGGQEGAGVSVLSERLLPGVVDTRADSAHAPIPVRFSLSEPGVVTLVIDDRDGRRVRNLVSETPFPAGQNVVYWDGLDESGRVNESYNGVYDVQGKLVMAGTYKVRGLVHKPLDLRYEFTLYNAAQVPWATSDKSSEWLTNHTPSASILFMPPGKAPERGGVPSPSGQLLVGSKVAEGGSGLAWIDAVSGHKLNGQMWVGGVWTGASHLARDVGDNPVAGVYAYTGASWPGDDYNGKKSELRLHELLDPDQKRERPGAWGKDGVWDPSATEGGNDTRMGSGEDRRLLSPNFLFPQPLVADQNGLSGLAVRNGILVASLPTQNQLLIVDARAHKAIGTVEVADPRGVAYDAGGGLLVLSGVKLLRFEMPQTIAAQDGKIALAPPQTLVSEGLDDPQAVALDGTGNIYISNRGQLHQVKVFSPQGAFVRAIGKAGIPQAGPYDQQRMNNPYGLTITQTPDGERLWVAEEDFKPKRLSVWKTDGTFVRALYGPTIYGGGGSFDPDDKTRFFHDGMEFQVDWKTGEDTPINIYYRPKKGELTLPEHMFAKVPETPIRAGGRLYITDAYTGSPTQGIDIAGIYQMRNGTARLVAAAGLANVWDALKTDALKPLLPPGADLSKSGDQPGATTFAWSDLNDDGQIQAPEVQFRTGWKWGGVTLLSDLSFVFPDSSRAIPIGFSAQGVPCYDLSRATKRFDWTVVPTSGSGQILDFPDGLSIATAGPIQAFRTGAVRTATAPTATIKAVAATAPVKASPGPLWTYPNQWPGLHASHYARLASAPGEILGATRLLGLPMSFRSADAQDKAPFNVWGINGNMGNGYLMTSDGLFVSTLFKDHRQSKPWPDKAVRNMPLNDVSMGGESFFNTISQTKDGKVYIQNTNHIVRVDGLDTLRRLPSQTLNVTPQLLAKAQDYFVARDAARLADKGSGTLEVGMRAQAPIVDGKLDEWADAKWVPLDAKTSAAVIFSGDTMYVAYKTGYRDLLKNAAESLPLLFKTGGALDVMISSDPKADPERKSPVAGDQRLLVTRVGEKLVAMRYRAVVNGAKSPVPFASPSRTVSFDRVDQVSDQIKLAQGTAPIEEFHAGNVFGDHTDKYEGTSYEMAIPLSLLDIAPAQGTILRGDLGILVGNGFQTIQRIYWNNKATGLVSDIPGEAMLTPQLWGNWEIKGEK